MDSDTIRIIEFCNELYSSYAPFKNFHLRTLSSGKHTMCDQINDDLYKWADSLLEKAFGIEGRPDFNPVKFTEVKSDDIYEILKVLTAKARVLRDSLVSPRYSGIVNILDDVVSGLNEWSYMIEMG